MRQDWPRADDEGAYTVTLEWRSRRVYEAEAGTPVGAVKSRTWPASASLAHAILRIVEASAPAGGGEGDAYLPGSGWGEGEGDVFRQGAVAEDEPEPEDIEREPATDGRRARGGGRTTRRPAMRCRCGDVLGRGQLGRGQPEPTVRRGAAP